MTEAPTLARTPASGKGPTTAQIPADEISPSIDNPERSSDRAIVPDEVVSPPIAVAENAAGAIRLFGRPMRHVHAPRHSVAQRLSEIGGSRHGQNRHRRRDRKIQRDRGILDPVGLQRADVQGLKIKGEAAT
ncbi:MAG: hypothetical protein ACK4L4_08760 [Gemmobacter sp.]